MRTNLSYLLLSLPGDTRIYLILKAETESNVESAIQPTRYVGNGIGTIVLLYLFVGPSDGSFGAIRVVEMW